MAKQMNTPEISHFNLDDIDLQERVGPGKVPVFRAEMAGKIIAVKKVDCEKNEIPREVEVHHSLPPHPNVLPIMGVTHSKDGFSIYICMHLAEKSLHHYLHTEKKKPSLQQSRKWAIQIAKGMRHVHLQGVAHRDLKSANILLFENEDVAKLCDFGSARLLERTATVTGMTGTYRWMAPEFNDKGSTKVNQRCDVFSFGMVLYELFAHEIPFYEIDDNVAVATSIREEKRPSVPPELPLYIRRLLQSCWKHEPNDRPTFEEILQVLDLEAQLHRAATTGDADEVRRLIGDHVNVNWQTEDGKAALHRAAEHGRVTVVQVLLQAQADVNLQDKDGRTALYLAALERRVTAVKMLLQKHANVHICDKGGASPLYAASQEGPTEVVDALLKSGADPNLATTDGSHPLGIAALKGHTQTVVRLLEGGANIHYQDKDGATALYQGSQEGHTEVVDTLLKCGADPNLACTPPECSAPLQVAAVKGHKQIVKLLQEGGAYINYQDGNGCTPLYSASREGHTEVVDVLLKSGADPNLTTTIWGLDGDDPLGAAALKGHTRTVVRLLEGGANINRQDNCGCTALIWASIKGHVDVVQLLLEKEADVSIRDEDGFTAMDTAMSEGHHNIADLLKKYNHTH